MKQRLLILLVMICPFLAGSVVAEDVTLYFGGKSTLYDLSIKEASGDISSVAATSGWDSKCPIPSNWAGVTSPYRTGSTSDITITLNSTTAQVITFYGLGNGSGERALSGVKVDDLDVTSSVQTTGGIEGNAGMTNFTVSGLSMQKGQKITFTFAKSVYLYYLVVTPAPSGPSTDTTLSSVKVKVGDDEFDASVAEEGGNYDYSYELAYNETASSVTVLAVTNDTNASATIANSGVVNSPANGAYTDVTITVTPEDTEAPTKDYILRLSKQASASSDNSISSFSVDDNVVEAVEGAYSYTIPYAYEGNPAIVVIPTDEEFATYTVSDFDASTIDGGSSIDVTITVKAQSGAEANYTLTINRTAAATGNIISSFSINGINGVISGNAISFTMHETTDVTTLVPVITLSEFATCAPGSGTTQDFTNPVTYTVTSESGLTNEYIVTVNLEDLNFDGPYPYETTFPTSGYDIPAWMVGNISFNNTYDGSDASLWYEGDETNKASVLRMNSANSSLDFYLSKCGLFEISVSATGSRTFNLLVNGVQVATTGNISSKTKKTLSWNVNLSVPVKITLENVGGGGATVGSLNITEPLVNAGNDTNLVLTGAWNATAFDGLFADAAAKAAVTSVDLTAVTGLPATISGLNPNCLFYVSTGSALTGPNVVTDGSADLVSISDASPFNNIMSVDADEVQYSPTYASGWASICLPFACTTIPDGVTVKAFTSAEGDVVTFTTVTELEANTPYIANVTAEEGVTFTSSEAITLPATAAATIQDVPNGSYTLKGTFSKIETGLVGSYLLNNDGSGFGVVTEGSDAYVPAFRAYMVSTGSGVRMLTLGNGDGATNIDAENIESGMMIWSNNGSLEIYSAKAQSVLVYSIDGRIVANLDLNEGQNSFTGFAKGLYLINNSKVVIK